MKKILSLFLASILFLSFALPSKTNAATKWFSDVPTTNASYTDVKYLVDNGVIESAAKFGLNDIVTREELVVMIAKALGLSGTQRKTKFTDVPKSNKNSGYIQSAVDAGIAKGITETKFEPNAKLTRGQIAAFIARAFVLPKGKNTFKDVVSTHYAYEFIQQLVAANIAAGYPDGTFKPNQNLTRAHAAAFLARAMRYSNKKEIETVASLSETWANALKTRDGKPRYDMMSDQAKEKFKKQQMVVGGNNWNYIIGNSNPWVVSYDIKVEGMKATITYLTQTNKPEYFNTQETVTFASDKNGKLYVKDYETVFENKLVESQKDSIAKLSETWANALITRDGKPRYDMMSDAAKEKFKKQQIQIGGNNWNYIIGNSSPWVVNYDIKIDGMTATITYLTQTSKPDYYNTQETVTFATDKNGKLYVKDYATVFENKLVQSQKETITKLSETWANALKTRDGKPRYDMMSDPAKEKFKRQQILLYGDGKNWNYTIGSSSPWVVDYEINIDGMKATITYLTQTSNSALYNTKEVVTFEVDKNGKCLVKDYETIYENRLIDSSKVKTIANLTEVWANALITRDGKPRYEMMSNQAKEKFKKQQILLYGDGKNWNYTIGSSSPWVVDYEMKFEGMTATITYLTQTSDPAYFNTMEVLTFALENGKIIVKDYETIYENRSVDSSKTINYLAEVWANALKTRDGKPRYDMMTNQAKEKFIKQQLLRYGDGKNWNYNIGVSSPWVVGYEIKIDGMKATITYLAQTSDPAYFQSIEVVTFTMENGKLLVKDFETIKDYEFIKK